MLIGYEYLYAFRSCFHIFLIFAVGLIRNSHPQFSCVKQWPNIVFSKITLTRDSDIFHHFFHAAWNLAEVYQRIPFDFDRNDLIINLVTILITVLVTSDQVEVHIFQHDAKIGAGGMEFRA